MPYNVCCLTCTVLALYYGVMLKLLTTTETERSTGAAPTRTRAKLLILLSLSVFLCVYYRDAIFDTLLDSVGSH